MNFKAKGDGFLLFTFCLNTTEHQKYSMTLRDKLSHSQVDEYRNS